MPYGVSEQMIDTWSEIIFDLSLNVQIRRGDPVRHLDHEAWQAQREDMGLTDLEIALKLGLATEQVTFIRNITERRRFRLNQYRKLYRLGGGKRYREDRYQDPEEKFEMSDAAVRLRQAIDIPADQAAQYIRKGYWGSKRVPDILSAHVANNPNDIALAGNSNSLTWKVLQERCHRMTANLHSRGLKRGDIIVSNLPASIDQITCYIATLMAGGVYLPLPPDTSAAPLAACLKRTEAAGVICNAAPEQPTLVAELAGLASTSKFLKLVIGLDGSDQQGAFSLSNLLSDNDNHTQAGPDTGLAATDPALLLPANNDNSCFAIFSHQNLLASVSTTKVEPDGSAKADTTSWWHFVHLALPRGQTVQIETGTSPKLTKPEDQLQSGPFDEASKFHIMAALLMGKNGEEARELEKGVEARVVNENGTPTPEDEGGDLPPRGPCLCVGYLGSENREGSFRTVDGWHRVGCKSVRRNNLFRLF